jgi:hypothetical protein
MRHRCLGFLGTLVPGGSVFLAIKGKEPKDGRERSTACK